MRGIIDYFGAKSSVSFITHAGNGCIVVAVAETGAAAAECLQARPWSSADVNPHQAGEA